MNNTSTTTEALHLLRSLSRPDPHGYVTLNAVPYRGHHLLLNEALRLTSPGDLIFEGGVSSGYFAETLSTAGRIVDGHELDPVAAEAARKICRNVWVGDLQQFDDNVMGNDYSMLMFGDTLEHIADPVAVLTRLRAHLRPGGHLVMSVPNIANLGIRLQLLGGRFRYTERGILDRTHLRFFTAKTLAETITAAGFNVQKIDAAVPVPGVTNEWACKIAHRVGNLRPSLFAYNFVATASA